jgi:tyrosyl-tRNA synthetase
MKTIIDCLMERGLIDALTSEEIRKASEHPLKAYVGFDPTSDSLHLGNLVGMIVLGWFQRYGHTPVIILGGGTGRIGDPSGKSSERPLLDAETIHSNVMAIQKNFEKILDFTHPTAKPVVLNNDTWLSPLFLIDFLRDIGKHFRIGPMLGKEMVRLRIDSEEGLSFTEFSYQLLQAYDFYYLFTHHGVTMQMGGSDQWGNITAGLDLIRKRSTGSAYGLTWPLVTRSDGKKFGKSEEGAIWLSPEKLSPYQFYQYLVRIPDSDVIKLMRLLTYMEMKEITSYEKEMSKEDYLPNTAQKRLAAEVTRLIHGEEGVEIALKVTESASPGSKASLDPLRLQEIARALPTLLLHSEEVIDQKYVDLVVKVGFLTSKGEALRLIQNQGAYLNEERVDDPQLRITPKDLLGEKYLIIGSGKKKKMLIEIKKPLA